MRESQLLATLAFFFGCHLPSVEAFHPSSSTGTTTIHRQATTCLSASRREAILSSVAMSIATTPVAWADVADGNTLPQAARQFSRSVQLRTDVQDVYKRLSTAAEGEIDETEWTNIGFFLRKVYQTADGDMKAVAGGVYSPAKQKEALAAIEKIKKNSQAADLYARRRDTKSLAGMMAKVDEGTSEFFDSLSDVPDEL